MCSPVAVMALQGVGGAFSAYSSYQAGQDQNEYYKHLARQNEREAEIVERAGQRQADYIQDQASRDSARVSEEAKRVDATQRAIMAANGVYGVTAEDIALDTLSKADKDRLAVRYNADLRTFETQQETGYRAANLRYEAGMNRAAGKNAKAAGYMNAGVGLLNAATSMASTWYQDQKLTQKKVEVKRDNAPSYSPETTTRNFKTKPGKLDVAWWKR